MAVVAVHQKLSNGKTACGRKAAGLITQNQQPVVTCEKCLEAAR